jgi:uncharacterized protein YciI
MDYLVLAFDAKDAQARERRQSATKAHVARASRLKEDGELHIGGPILDDAGATIGSAQFVRFETQAQIDAYVRDDPYTQSGVWDDVRVLRVDLRECTCVVRLKSALGGGKDDACLRKALDVLSPAGKRP